MTLLQHLGMRLIYHSAPFPTSLRNAHPAFPFLGVALPRLLRVQNMKSRRHPEKPAVRRQSYQSYRAALAFDARRRSFSKEFPAPYLCDDCCMTPARLHFDSRSISHIAAFWFYAFLSGNVGVCLQVNL